MNNKKCFELFQHLNSLQGLHGVKFSYFVAKNINTLEPEVKALKESIKPSEDFNIYEKERISLAEKYAKKDENNKPVVENNQYIIEDTEVFEKELQALNKKHKESIDKRNNQIKDFEKILEEKNKIKLTKIKLEDIPENISTEQLLGIYALIEE